MIDQPPQRECLVGPVPEPRKTAMPNPLVLLPLVVFLACASTPDDGGALTNNREKLGYSVGYQVGGDFVRQGLRIDPELVIRGVEDALAGVDPLMTPDEMQRTLVELKKKATDAQ